MSLFKECLVLTGQKDSRCGSQCEDMKRKSNKKKEKSQKPSAMTQHFIQQKANAEPFNGLLPSQTTKGRKYHGTSDGKTRL